MPVMEALRIVQLHDPARGPFEVTTPSFLRTNANGQVRQFEMRVGKTARARIGRGGSSTVGRSRNSMVQNAVKKLTSRQQRHADSLRRNRVLDAKGLVKPGSLNPHKGW